MLKCKNAKMLKCQNAEMLKRQCQNAKTNEILGDQVWQGIGKSLQNESATFEPGIT